MWDAIVLGSGIGGLGAAAALARQGRRVLVLEQHDVAGGLTQTFTRADWTFATGVHYIGGVGDITGSSGQIGRLLAWLTGGALRFVSCGNPYDIVRLPDFEFAIPYPEARYREALLARFPQQSEAVGRWFAACEAARHSAFAMFAMRGMPQWLAWGMHLIQGDEVERWAQCTLASALADVPDAQLRAVLGARWGDYGAPPERAPMLEHALVTSSYNAGAYYPAGGPARFASTLVPVVEAAGGEVQLGACVERILVTGGHVVGVAFNQGGTRRTEFTSRVISAMGIANTVSCLDAATAPAWQDTLRGLRPGLAHLALYIGFDGDIAAAGASGANIWIYESEEIGRVWQNVEEDDPPGLFVSFPSMKDRTWAGKPTAEVIALCDARAFASWLDTPDGRHSAPYQELKGRIEQRLLARFRRHFPALAPLIRFHELSTPVTQQRYLRSPGGAMYGLDVTASRLTSAALRVRTPVHGLLLAGQDVTGPGVAGAFMGGLMAAAVIEPAILTRFAS
ncbi:phytoene desaturase family protein [Paraburkholderia bryophila]|uniref:All-trans-retinol 13,14-reductase n=1 Tax=Paraburkholderia bryophila TaxID=420952 RepID=A0A7Y9WIU9_9BURK|nr:NAD(P)/FAD-dependent oxidoreductase [Paraburkholderia bryophila]NYH21001.1 all-trans-retinol 13,14-reductase [Paraburkholderia bryophila]